MAILTFPATGHTVFITMHTEPRLKIYELQIPVYKRSLQKDFLSNLLILPLCHWNHPHFAIFSSWWFFEMFTPAFSSPLAWVAEWLDAHPLYLLWGSNGNNWENYLENHPWRAVWRPQCPTHSLPALFGLCHSSVCCPPSPCNPGLCTHLKWPSPFFQK